ncbi:hypothetical protein ABB30_13005 [Stenotrophomonas ginsengisoli]|uniref:Uncharacterized protein n=1 Tax=Stenotrophomonas ginsengisoli TaxID=336566 RepID=A0A0R0D0V6_9GAMM|nr:hypothetical protein ABB30_13005 [Stenotrophomonas ginsengisoli]
MFNHVVADDVIESIIVEGQAGAIDFLEMNASIFDALVDYIHGMDLALRAQPICDQLTDDAGTAANLQNTERRAIALHAEQAADLGSLGATTFDIQSCMRPPP